MFYKVAEAQKVQVSCTVDRADALGPVPISPFLVCPRLSWFSGVGNPQSQESALLWSARPCDLLWPINVSRSRCESYLGMSI